MRYPTLIALIIGMLAASAAASEPLYELSVSFQPEEHLVRGTASVVAADDNSEVRLHTAGLTVLGATVDGRDAEPAEDGSLSGRTVEVTYLAEFPPGEAGRNGGLVSTDSIVLTGGWYPAPEGLARYRLSALVPEGFSAVSEAEEITVRATPEGALHAFTFPHPLEGLTLAAARYQVVRREAPGVSLYAYFLPEDSDLADTYMEKATGYLARYGEMFGPYPYRRFSVVEAPLPLGHAMPTFTLLGSTVARLPFIPDTSLGHEVLHQWFGGYVYADRSQGNWLEGLTTYFSDHLYREDAGEGWHYRRSALLDYESYVNEDNEIPLREFIGRTDFATRSAGYGKAALVFHALKRRLGQEMFTAALRQFLSDHAYRRASWGDLQAAFEAEQGDDLGWFFDQWVDRRGLLWLRIGDARVLIEQGAPLVTFRAIQVGQVYRASLPVIIRTTAGEEVHEMELTERDESFEIRPDGDPLELIIDPGYDVPRHLSPEEDVPSVAWLWGDRKRLGVIPAEGAGPYAGLVDALEAHGFDLRPEAEVTDADLSASSVLVLGAESAVLDRLFAGSIEGAGEGGFRLIVRRNPLNSLGVVAQAVAGSREEADAVSGKLFRYGRYARLAFDAGANVLKEEAHAERGIRVSLSHRVMGVPVRQALSLPDIIERVIDTPVIYVGEGHTRYEDHKVQLAVIRALQERGRDFAIGMEMFNRPEQSSLDDYIAGITTEKEFLKASKYFTTWRFNYHLYREILDYARSHGIPVVALNQERDVIHKTASQGLDALTEEEKAKVPADLDMTNRAYRQALRATFRQHDNAEARNFENFYQAQVLWDEIMAHSLDDFLRENPGHQMVVVVGSGHVAYGYGIPDRLKRLNGRDYATLMNVESAPGAGASIGAVADYVFFADSLQPITPPLLGVSLEAVEGKERMRIKEVSPGAPASAAGLRRGDVLVTMDGQEIAGMDDIRVALFDKRRGDTLELTVLRPRFLFKDKLLDFSIEFR